MENSHSCKIFTCDIGIFVAEDLDRAQVMAGLILADYEKNTGTRVPPIPAASWMEINTDSERYYLLTEKSDVKQEPNRIITL